MKQRNKTLLFVGGWEEVGRCPPKIKVFNKIFFCPSNYQSNKKNESKFGVTDLSPGHEKNSTRSCRVQVRLKLLIILHNYKLQGWSIRFKDWKRFAVVTVPTFKKYPIGTVPTSKKYPIGTLPTSKKYDFGTTKNKILTQGYSAFYRII